MTNTNSKEYKDALKAYLLPIVQERAADMGQTITGNPYAWVLDVARGAVGYEFERHSEQAGMCHWLQGLGMGVDYTNTDIAKLAEEWHGCTLTDKEVEKVVENWFTHIAWKIIQFSRETK